MLELPLGECNLTTSHMSIYSIKVLVDNCPCECNISEYLILQHTLQPVITFLIGNLACLSSIFDRAN